VAGRIEERQQARLLRRLEAKGTFRGSKSHPVQEIETQHIRDNRGFRSQVQAAGQQGRQVPGTSCRTIWVLGTRYKLQGQQERQVPGTSCRTIGASGRRYKLQDNRGVRSQVQAAGQEGRQVPGTSCRTTGASGPRY
jgi:hypothetical protein